MAEQSARNRLKVAIVHDAFFDENAEDSLLGYLREARSQGASLAVLCELPFNHWMAINKEFDAENAEPLGVGKRRRLLSKCAREAGIAVLGGAIAYPRDAGADAVTVEKCENTCWLCDEHGNLQVQYGKVHLPSEEGYWEDCHYSPSRNLPAVFSFSPGDTADAQPWRIGIQICSDIMRPAGAAHLASQNMHLLLHPRATPLSSYERRWRPVLRAAALTSACYAISVNRPSHGQADTPCGGDSLVMSPSGEVLCETSRPLTIVELDMGAVQLAKSDYPGYLKHAAQLKPSEPAPHSDASCLTML